jgi:uncharacterized membrane protein YdfJ with MMPL/SSD domain
VQASAGWHDARAAGGGAAGPPPPWPARRPWLAIALWIALAVGALPLLASVTRDLQPQGLDVAGSAAVWADDQLGRLNAPPAAAPTLISGLSFAEAGREAQASGIPRAWLHAVPGGGVLLLPPGATPPARVAPLLAAVARAGGRARHVSSGAIGDEVSRDAEATLRHGSLAALPLLLLLLPLVFGSVVQALLPLAVAAAGSELALAAVSVLERHMSLSVYLIDIVTFLALGVGVDYALFIVTRFRDALDRGADARAATAEAMRTAGRSVVYSGTAVALAVASLLLAGTSYWRGLAVGGMLAVACVLLATHTLLPALLRLIGPRIRRGRIPWAMGDWPLWRSLAGWSTWRPWLSVVVGVGLLALPALAAPSLRVRVPAELASLLPRGSALRQANRLVEQLRGAGSLAPLPVVLRLPTTVDQAATWRTVATVSERLRRLPGVASVASPTSSGLPPEVLAQAAASPAALDGPLAAFVNPSAAPHVVALFVTSAHGPDSAATRALLEAVERTVARSVPPGSRTGVGGVVGVLHAFQARTDRRLPWIVAAAAGVALAVLLGATGSLVQAVLGVLLDGLVALATAGVLVLTVQHGSFGLEAEPVNMTVAPLIFVLLFGLSMDYEVILLHRIQEKLRAGDAPRAAAMGGIAETGGMITGAGLIMVAVFAVLLGSPLEILQTLAIGMVAAILLDTWIVRSFLIPGFTALLGRWAFWAWTAGGVGARGPGA